MKIIILIWMLMSVLTMIMLVACEPVYRDSSPTSEYSINHIQSDSVSTLDKEKEDKRLHDLEIAFAKNREAVEQDKEYIVKRQFTAGGTQTMWNGVVRSSPSTLNVHLVLKSKHRNILEQEMKKIIDRDYGSSSHIIQVFRSEEAYQDYVKNDWEGMSDRHFNETMTF